MLELALVAALGWAVVDLATHAGLTRFAWTLAINAAAVVDAFPRVAARRLRPPRFALLGECCRCGECCRRIVADLPSFVKDTPFLSVFVFYHRVLHRFRVTGRGPHGEVIFACDHVRPDGRCAIHTRRPLLCRDFPVLPFFDEPSLLPACTYRVAPREVARMRRRASLRILNPGVTVHHPTRERRGEIGRTEGYEWLDDGATS